MATRFLSLMKVRSLTSLCHYRLHVLVLCHVHGRIWDIGMHDKHETKNLKLLVPQQRPAAAEFGTLACMASIRVKNLKFLVH